MSVKIPVSIGELFDKISILENKSKLIIDKAKLKNIRKEYVLLHKIALKINDAYEKDGLYKKLKKINRALWDIEEGKRQCERESNFGSNFVDLARQVYIQNDNRAKAKRAINKKYGSDLMEEKSYKKY